MLKLCLVGLCLGEFGGFVGGILELFIHDPKDPTANICTAILFVGGCVTFALILILVELEEK